MTENIPQVTPPYQQPVTYPVVKRDSTLALISMISGIVGWTILPFIGSIVAVITGHLAKKEIRILYFFLFNITYSKIKLR